MNGATPAEQFCVIQRFELTIVGVLQIRSAKCFGLGAYQVVGVTLAGQCLQRELEQLAVAGEH